VPALTEAMRLALEAVELAGGGALCERRVSRPVGGEAYEVDARILKQLIREGLIEVMGLAPAVYRVTKLGRLARKAAGRVGGGRRKPSGDLVSAPRADAGADCGEDATRRRR